MMICDDNHADAPFVIAESCLPVPTLVDASAEETLTPSHEQALMINAMSHESLIILKNWGLASVHRQPDVLTSLILGHVLHSNLPLNF